MSRPTSSKGRSRRNAIQSMHSVRPVPVDLAQKVADLLVVFATYGFEQTPMDLLAQQIGVPRATLYYYFGSKDEVFAFAVERYLVRMSDALSPGVATDAPAPERLVNAVRSYLDFAAKNGAAYMYLSTDLGRGRAVSLEEVSTQFRDLVYQHFARILEDGKNEGSFRALTTETAVGLVAGSVNRVAQHYLIFSGAIDASKVAAELVDALLNGLTLQAAP